MPPPSEDYRRLAPGETVGLLKAPFPITATSFEKDATGAVSVVHAKAEKPVEGAAPKKPKRYAFDFDPTSPNNLRLGFRTVPVTNLYLQTLTMTSHS